MLHFSCVWLIDNVWAAPSIHLSNWGGASKISLEHWLLMPFSCAAKVRKKDAPVAWEIWDKWKPSLLLCYWCLNPGKTGHKTLRRRIFFSVEDKQGRKYHVEKTDSWKKIVQKAASVSQSRELGQKCCACFWMQDTVKTVKNVLKKWISKLFYNFVKLLHLLLLFFVSDLSVSAVSISAALP